MRILHVLNTAGVASIISKFMDEIHDTNSTVVTRKAHDRYGFTTYGETWSHGFWLFLIKIMLKARHYDLVHIHDRDILIPLLKRMYPKKPVIIHYHGTKIRGSWNERKKYWKHADRILVSTADLFEGAPEGVLQIPNPVDTSIFFPVSDETPEEEALYFKYDADEIAMKLAKMHSMKLTIHDRKKNPISYRDMPRFLIRFKAFIDVKRDVKGNILYPENDMSKTALEALACGLKVIHLGGKITKKLPEQHDPYKVSKKVYRIYIEELN